MNILEALKDPAGDVVVYSGNRFLFWSNNEQAWIVRGRNSARRAPMIVTEDEENAVAVLLGQEQ